MMPLPAFMPCCLFNTFSSGSNKSSILTINMTVRNTGLVFNKCFSEVAFIFRSVADYHVAMCACR